MSDKWQKKRTLVRATPHPFLSSSSQGHHAADAMAYAFMGVDRTPPGAGDILGGLRPEPQRLTYQIPADKVVPGMILCCLDLRWPVTAVGHGWIEVLNGDPRRFVIRDAGVATVQLPGPSPRELACIGASFHPYLKPGDEPAAHVACDCGDGRGCPVAPVPGRHGGMRLWPAPWRGEAWSYEGGGTNIGGCGWRAGDLYAEQWEVSQAGQPTDRYHARGHADAILQCFYLPPEPQPERRETTPWAPHAGYEGLAVKYG